MRNTANRRKELSKQQPDPIRSVGKIVSAATFGLFVIILIKYVDGRYHRELETAAQATLEAQNADQQLRLERYQSDSQQMQANLKRIEEQSITFAELTQVQDQLLALAKEHHCTLKKASPRVKGTTDFKPSRETNDRPDNQDTHDEVAVEFQVNQAGLAINVAGELDHILSFMKAVREKTWFACTDQLTLRREANTGGKMALEMELNFMSLQRKNSPESDLTNAPKT